MTLPRAILFDWDNTLASNWGLVADSFNRTLAAFGHPTIPLARTREVLALAPRVRFQQFFGERMEEARAMFYAHFRARHLEVLRPAERGEDLLAWLEKQGVPAFVLSNKTGDLLRAEVAHLGWGRYFLAVVGSGDAPRDKPDPAAVHFTLENSGIAPAADVWLVGDTDVDLACAAAAGLTGVLLGQDDAEGERQHWVKDCASLRRLLEGLAPTPR